jgi:hypothetical protein
MRGQRFDAFEPKDNLVFACKDKVVPVPFFILAQRHEGVLG